MPGSWPTEASRLPWSPGQPVRVPPWPTRGPSTARSPGSSQRPGCVTLVDESTFTISGRRRRHRRAGRPRASSSGTPGSSPASSCWSTGPGPSPWPRSPTTRSRPPSSPGACPRRGRADSTLMVFRPATSARGCARTSSSATSATSPPSARSRSSSTADFADLFAVKEGRVGRRARGRRDRPSLSATVDHRSARAGPSVPRDRRPSRYSYRRGGVVRGGRAPAPSGTSAERRPGQLRVDRPRPGRVDDLHRGRTGHRGQRRSTRGTAAASRSSGPPRPSGWPSGAARCPRSRPTTRAAGRSSPAAPRTSARCASSTPTIPNGWSWPPARRGS